MKFDGPFGDPQLQRDGRRRVASRGKSQAGFLSRAERCAFGVGSHSLINNTSHEDLMKMDPHEKKLTEVANNSVAANFVDTSGSKAVCDQESRIARCMHAKDKATANAVLK